MQNLTGGIVETSTHAGGWRLESRRGDENDCRRSYAVARASCYNRWYCFHPRFVACSLVLGTKLDVGRPGIETLNTAVPSNAAVFLRSLHTSTSQISPQVILTRRGNASSSACSGSVTVPTQVWPVPVVMFDFVRREYGEGMQQTKRRVRL